MWHFFTELRDNGRVVPDSEHRDRDFQMLLLNFLTAELEIGFTLCETATLESGMDEAAFLTALANAEKALATIRKFEESIADQETWRAIHDRANTLEALISNLKAPTMATLKQAWI